MPEKQLKVIDLGQQSYQPVWDFQRRLQRQRIDQQIPDTLLFVEHRPVYTIGKNGKDLHVIASESFLKERGIEVIHVDRGGDVTYHGPGQLVGYPIFDLRQHQKSVSWYMRQLEAVFIEALGSWGLTGRRDDEFTGVWVGTEKILAIGVRISRWVTMHGFAFNVSTNLGDFGGIIPCGIFHKGVTSLEELLPQPTPLDEVKVVVQASFMKVFEFGQLITDTEDVSTLLASKGDRQIETA